MDHSRFLFIIKGEIADNIHSFQREGRYTRIIYDSGKDYPYNRENVRILSNPKNWILITMNITAQYKR